MRVTPDAISQRLSQRFPQVDEGLVQRICLDGLLADRAGVGDRVPVSHHVDPTLRRADQPRSRDLDPRLDALTGGVLAEGADRGQPALTSDLVHPTACLVDGLVERPEPLPADTGPVPDGDLPAQAPRLGFFGRFAGGPVIFSGPS